MRYLFILLLIGCSTSNKNKADLMPDYYKKNKIEILKLHGEDKVVIYYDYMKNLRFQGHGPNGGYHYGVSKPEDLYRDLLSAYHINKIIKKNNYKQMISKHITNIYVNIHKKDIIPHIQICFKVNHKKDKNCGYLIGEKELIEAIEIMDKLRDKKNGFKGSFI